MSSLPFGSPADIDQRIRRFYKYWNDAVGELPRQSKIALPVDEIDIELETLPQNEADHYGARQAYIASGFVMRGFYPGAGRRYETEQRHDRWIVRGPVPTAVGRCARVPRPGVARTDLEAGEQMWLDVFEAQEKPAWEHKDRFTQWNLTDLPTFFAWPRVMAIQASARSANGDNPSESVMNEWRQRCDTEDPAFDEASGPDGATDYWEQLPTPPGLRSSREERKMGSPSTPLFSPFRLTTCREGDGDKSVVVIFCITYDARNGIFRPWRKERAIAHRAPTVPNVPHPDRLSPIISSLHQPVLSTLEPSIPRKSLVGPSDPRAYLGSQVARPHHEWKPPSRDLHSLSHRKQMIYDQSSARGGRRFAEF